MLQLKKAVICHQLNRQQCTTTRSGSRSIITGGARPLDRQWCRTSSVRVHQGCKELQLVHGLCPARLSGSIQRTWSLARLLISYIFSSFLSARCVVLLQSRCEERSMCLFITLVRTCLVCEQVKLQLLCKQPNWSSHCVVSFSATLYFPLSFPFLPFLP